MSSHEHGEMEREITIGIPMFNAASFIARVLTSLTLQNRRFLVILVDNGSSDGTPEMLAAAIANNFYGDLHLLLTAVPQLTGGKSVNVPNVRAALVSMVKTPFLFFLDADVGLPPLAIADLLEEMKQDTKLGGLGLLYEPASNHVKLGAMLVRTELAQKIKWQWDDKGCDCEHFARQAAVLGYEVRHYKGYCARHLKCDQH